jgi:hypothetical protein
VKRSQERLSAQAISSATRLARQAGEAARAAALAQAERLRAIAEGRDEPADAGSVDLVPVPSFLSSPVGWFQASLINAGRQDEATRRALTTVLGPAADSLQSIADEDRNPRTAAFNRSFWTGIEAWGGVFAALNETRRYTGSAARDGRWSDVARGARGLAQESWELARASLKVTGLALWGIVTTPVRIFSQDIPQFSRAISERLQGRDRAWDVVFTGAMLEGDLAATYALARPTGIVNRLNWAIERHLFGSLEAGVPTEFLPPSVTGQWRNWNLPSGVTSLDLAYVRQAAPPLRIDTPFGVAT